MRDVVILFLNLIVTVVRLARPGGSVPSLPSRCLLVKHQLRILNRGRKRVLPTCAPQSVSLPEYKVTEVGG